MIQRFSALGILVVFLFSGCQIIPWLGSNRNEASPQQQTREARPYYEKALEAQEEGRTRRAIKNYEKVFEDYPAADFAAQSLYNYGIIYYEKKKWDKAYEGFQKVLAYHPDFPKFDEIVHYQFDIALSLYQGENVRFLWLIPYRAMNRSSQYFEILIQNAPYHDLAPLALMNVALIYQYKGETARAIDALDRLINSYPNSLLADDAYLSLAETFGDLVQGPLYDQGATREAMSYFEDFLILFSENEKVGKAEEGLAEMEEVYARSKFVIGKYYFKYRNWYEAAEIFFDEAITIAPNSEAADQARDYIERIEEIQAQQEENPDSESRKKEKFFLKRWFDSIIS